jgi:hypothetical protein
MQGKKHELSNAALRRLPQDLKEFLIRAIAKGNPELDSFNGVVAGDCPVCGSFNTLEGADTPLCDPTVGICLDCCSINCLECGEIFEKGQTACHHWQVCEQCEISSEDGCGTAVWDCSKIEHWKKSRGKKN